jgi:hypothetical protein
MTCLIKNKLEIKLNQIGKKLSFKLYGFNLMISYTI